MWVHKHTATQMDNIDIFVIVLSLVSIPYLLMEALKNRKVIKNV